MRSTLISAIVFLSAVPGAGQSEELPAIIDGLAVYKIGRGEPVFLMPYPHASAAESMSKSQLARIFIEQGRTVITFDPPGVFRSTRPPKVDMNEMIDCTLETLCHFGVKTPIAFAGHSMGSLCALAFSIHHPDSVSSLILVGSTSGWRAVSKYGIHKHPNWTPKERRKLMFWGTRIFLGFGNLAIQKNLDRMIDRASYVNCQYVREIHIAPEDRRKPAHPRARWGNYLRRENIEYGNCLASLDIPVLICAGRHDPQTPLPMSQELHCGISDSEMVVFEGSGHCPHVEEKDRFTLAVDAFYRRIGDRQDPTRR